MPVGKQYTYGPISVGPFYPENLPFGLKYLFQDAVNNPVQTVNLARPSVNLFPTESNDRNKLLEELRKNLARPSVNQEMPSDIQNTLMPQQNAPVVDRSALPSGLSYLQRALALTQEQPDIASLQEYARARQAQGQQLMLNALAAGIAGPQYQGLQQSYLRRAMAAQEPEQIGPGMAYGGKYISDPYAGRKEQANILAETGKELFKAEEEAKKENQRGFQQGGAAALPDGTIVSTMFDPKSGSYVYETPSGLAKLPAGSRPTTPGVAGPLSAQQFNTLTSNLNNEQNSLNRINKYLSTVENSDVGLSRIANNISANFKTAFNTGQLTPKELNQQIARGQLQGLLGLLRIDVVGPGVMTEQDALRIIQAVGAYGGDTSVLQNPEVVKSLLKDIIEQKQNRIDLLNRQVKFSERFYPGIINQNYSTNQSTIEPSLDYGAPPAGAVRRK